MRLFWIIISFILVSAPPIHAQDDAPPLIILDKGGIYAVSSRRSTALVEAPENYDEFVETHYERPTLFSAEWLSPDGQYLAYTTFARDPQRPERVAMENLSSALYLLDLHNGGKPIPVRLSQNGIYAIKSVVWSADGAMLYVLAHPSRSAPSVLMFVARDAWDDLPAAVTLPIPDYAFARRLIPAPQGVVVQDNGLTLPEYRFWWFETPDSVPVTYTVDYTISPDVNLYVNTPFTPLWIEDELRYGLVNMFSGELLYTVDLTTGAVSPPDDFGNLTALVSGLAPDDSLRVSTGMYSDFTLLILYDPENTNLGSVDRVRSYAFGIFGDSIGSTFALSPDGQTLAYLQDGEIYLWQAGESAPLDISAQVIAWSPVQHIAMYYPAYFIG